jgi:KDO2-lipid IV(A) lauroyltransferase
MKRKKTGLLKKLQWRAECLAFLTVERFLSFIAIDTLWKAGAGLSGLARLFASRWPTVRNNLRTVLGPDATEEELAILTRDVFRHTAANLLTTLKGSHMSPEEIRGVLTIENEEAAWRVYAQKKGTIIIIPHMGNWELLAQAMPAYQPEIKMASIFRPLNNIYLDRVLRERRERNGMKMFAKLTSLHGPVKFLKHTQALALLVDQRAGRFGTLTPFFGRLMSMSPLPELFSRLSGAPVLGISMRTNAPGRWTLRFHEPKLAEGEKFTTVHMAELLENIIRESVVDEFWMQNLWRINKRRPLEIRGRTGPVRFERDRDKPLYSFSVLVRVPDHADRFAETVPALSALAASRPDMEIHLLARESLRAPAAAAGFSHSFHAIEDDELPAALHGRLQVAIVLTEEELAARELARLFAGPTYSLPGVEQSNKHWNLVAADPAFPTNERWLEVLRILGMHDPPLQWEYL